MAYAKQAAHRPLKFASVNELQEAVDSYFSECDKAGEPYLVTGLAYHLHVSRQTLCNYEVNEEFLDTIKQAKTKIESSLERKLIDKEKFTPGVIFSLKNNCGWKDKIEQDLSISGGLDLSGGIQVTFTDATAPEPDKGE